MKDLSPTQQRLIEHLASSAPAWVIRAGRVTSLEVLERNGLLDLRLGRYGWEARITQKGLDVVGKQ